MLFLNPDLESSRKKPTSPYFKSATSPQMDFKVSHFQCNFLSLLFLATFAIIYPYSAELYPTVVRSVGMSLSSCFARIGGAVAPFIGYVNSLRSSNCRLLCSCTIPLAICVVHNILTYEYKSYTKLYPCLRIEHVLDPWTRL
jgi:hypothetical protein